MKEIEQNQSDYVHGDVDPGEVIANNKKALYEKETSVWADHTTLYATAKRLQNDIGVICVRKTAGENVKISFVSMFGAKEPDPQSGMVMLISWDNVHFDSVMAVSSSFLALERCPVIIKKNDDHSKLKTRIRTLESHLHHSLKFQAAPMLSQQTREERFPVVELFPHSSEMWITELRQSQTQAQLCIVDFPQVAPDLLVPLKKCPPSMYDRENTLLGPEDFCNRFKDLTSDQMRLQALSESVLKLQQHVSNSGDSGSAASSRFLLQKELHLSEKRMVVIVCGFEKAGKSTMLDCIAQRKITYTHPTRATVCPVVYNLERNADAAMEGFRIGSSPTKFPLSQLKGQVQSHMERIQATPEGASMEELVVYVTAADVQSITLIDCPGVLINPKGAHNAKFEIEFSKKVLAMIEDQIEKANIDRSVVLCVEKRDCGETDGGVGSFYRQYLKKIIQKCPQVKHRIRLALNRNDDLYKSDNTWPDGDDVLLKSKYADCRKLLEGEPGLQVYLTSLKGIDGIYNNHSGDVKEIEHQREALLKRNYQTLRDAFRGSDLGKEAFWSKFDVEKFFDFREFREQVFSDLESVSRAASEQTLRSIDELAFHVSKLLQQLRARSSMEARCTPLHMIKDSFLEVKRVFELLGNEGTALAYGLAPPNLAFDQDEFCEKEFHSKWPLQMSFPPPEDENSFSIGCLENYLKVHKVSLHYKTNGAMNQFLKDHIDSYDDYGTNLIGRYCVMIDSLAARLFSVHLSILENETISAALDGNRRGGKQDHTHAAQQVALRAIKLVYTQFYQYAKAVIAHFLERSFDLSIYVLRLKEECRKSPASFVWTWESPLATLCHLLHEGVRRWVDQEMQPLLESIPTFAVSGDREESEQDMAFAKLIYDRIASNADAISPQDADSLSDILITYIDKNAKLQHHQDKGTTVREFKTAGVNPQAECCRVFEMTHRRLARNFHDVWTRKKEKIFGASDLSMRKNHLKSFVWNFVTTPIMKLQHQPLFMSEIQSPVLKSDDFLFVDNMRSPEELEKYLKDLYNLDENEYKGSAKRAELLEKISNAILAK